MKDGILLIHKPIGLTSRDVVNEVSHLLKTKKIGHTGSLDPFATGLLILTVNKGTKLGPFIQDYEKTYQATLVFGVKTATGDLTGEIIEKSSIITLTEEYVTQVLETFLGKSLQLPPMYSALKKDGVPLYKLAREGQKIEREKREITITKIHLISLTSNSITFEATVSKGTYIRTLGEDIAEKMGMVGHLTALTRTSVGPFLLKEALPMKDVRFSNLKSPLEALKDFPYYVIESEKVKDIYNGRPMTLPCKDEKVLLINAQKEVLAIYTLKEDGLYYSLRGLF